MLRSLVNQSALFDSEWLPIPENGQAAECLVNNVFCIYVVYLICREWYFRQSRLQYQLVYTTLVHRGLVQLVSNVFTVRTRIYEFNSGRPQIGIIDSGGCIWHSTGKVEDDNGSNNFSPRSATWHKPDSHLCGYTMGNSRRKRVCKTNEGTSRRSSHADV